MNDNAPAIRAGDATSFDVLANNINAKLQVCDLILKSGLCPSHIKTREQVFGILVYGEEIGFSPMQSLQSIAMIQGKPTVDVNGLQAKITQAGGLIEEIEHTDQLCKLKMTRGKQSRFFDFTMEDARLMGLAGKDNWKRMPKDMLYARAVSRGARRMFADVIKGLYGKEEMLDVVIEHHRDTEPAPIEAKVIEATAAVANLKTADQLPPKENEPVYYLIPNITSDQYHFISGIGEEIGGGHWLVFAPEPKVRRKMKKYECAPPEHIVERDEKGRPMFINPTTGEEDTLPESMGEDR